MTDPSDPDPRLYWDLQWSCGMVMGLQFHQLERGAAHPAGPGRHPPRPAPPRGGGLRDAPAAHRRPRAVRRRSPSPRCSTTSCGAEAPDGSEQRYKRGLTRRDAECWAEQAEAATGRRHWVVNGPRDGPEGGPGQDPPMPSSWARTRSMTSSAPPPIDSRRRVAEVAGRPRLLHVADAAVELEARVGDLAVEPAGHQLGDGGVAGGVLAARGRPRRRCGCSARATSTSATSSASVNWMCWLSASGVPNAWRCLDVLDGALDARPACRRSTCTRRSSARSGTGPSAAGSPRPISPMVLATGTRTSTKRQLGGVARTGCPSLSSLRLTEKPGRVGRARRSGSCPGSRPRRRCGPAGRASRPGCRW